MCRVGWPVRSADVLYRREGEREREREIGIEIELFASGEKNS